MSFTTIPFWYYLISLYVFYWLVRNYKFQNGLLLIGGGIFIGWIHTWYVLLISFIILSTYLCSLILSRSVQKRKFIFIAGLFANLGMLVLFKYSGFLGNNLITLGSALGIHLDLPTVNFLLPLGISFYPDSTSDIFCQQIHPRRVMVVAEHT